MPKNNLTMVSQEECSYIGEQQEEEAVAGFFG